MIAWRKPICILLILTVAIAGITYDRWLPEVSHSIKGAVGAGSGELAGGLSEENLSDQTKHKFDYMITSGDAITLGYNGDEIIFHTFPNDPSSVRLQTRRESCSLKSTDKENFTYQVDDERFGWISVKPAKDEDENRYIVIITDKTAMEFQADQRRT